MKREKKVRILFSEGSSLSAREALSALGPLGYEIHICDPDPFCICRFSKYVKKYHQSPTIGIEPIQYLNFIENIISNEIYDVLLAVHEQAFLFSKFATRLQKHVGLAISSFDNLIMLQSKILFMNLLDKLEIPHPKTELCRSGDEIRNIKKFPCYIKTEYGTACSGVWRINRDRELDNIISTLEKNGVLDGQNQIMIQDAAPGNLEIAYACFDNGQLLSIHCCRRQMEGARGSSSAKIGVHRPIVIEHFKKIGEYLAWHGSLAIDYLLDTQNNLPYYIDANPRLVEPMNAAFNGINIPELQVNLSLQKSCPCKITDSKEVKSHMLMMSLLGIADRGASRTALVLEILKALFKKGIYSKSKEELTDIRTDPLSLIPFSVVFIQLLINPGFASRISAKSIKNYSLTGESINRIKNADPIA